MTYIVTNSEKYHLSATEDQYQSLCGRTYTPDECSVVTEEPQQGFSICGNCEKKQG